MIFNLISTAVSKNLTFLFESWLKPAIPCYYPVSWVTVQGNKLENDPKYSENIK